MKKLFVPLLPLGSVSVSRLGWRSVSILYKYGKRIREANPITCVVVISFLQSAPESFGWGGGEDLFFSRSRPKHFRATLALVDRKWLLPIKVTYPRKQPLVRLIGRPVEKTGVQKRTQITFKIRNSRAETILNAALSISVPMFKNLRSTLQLVFKWAQVFETFYAEITQWSNETNPWHKKSNKK